MTQSLEITITADIPDGESDIQHEAIVATKEPLLAIADQLTQLGFSKVGVKKGVKVRRPKKTAAAKESV